MANNNNEATEASFYFSGPSHEFRDLLCKIVGCKHNKPKVRFWTISFDADEPLPKAQHMQLTKPIKPGFRRPFTITPDEDVDVNDTGTFVKVENVLGDSTVTIDPASTAKSIKGWLNGDGATGTKAVRFSADGHVGPDEQVITLDVEYEVSTPDATTLGFVEGVDEVIPA